jgi:hypothetical protein
MKVTRPKATISVRKVSRTTTEKNPFIFDPKADKVEFRMPTPIAEVERRAKQYFGDDPAKFLHSNRTHRTASEAFKDADYATAIWKCKTDWDRTKEYLGWIAVWVFTLGTFYIFALGFEKWMSL